MCDVVIGLLTRAYRNTRRFSFTFQCEISSNDGVGLTRMDGSDLKLSTCTIDRNGIDRVKRSKDVVDFTTATLTAADTKASEHTLIADAC